jgi:DNA-binding NarL/FixJ family response regulator
MLTVSAEEQDLFKAIVVGAQGYVLKNVGARQLHDLLRGVVRGDAPLSGAMAAKILAEFSQMKQPGPESLSPQEKLEALTDREISILQYVVDGSSNAEIGEKLHLSEQTIKKELSNVMQKLHLNNRVQLAAHALRTRLAK